MYRLRLRMAASGGFALPTVLIASVIMLLVLTTAISAIGSSSAAIDSQYYNQLAREAAEAGEARATDCLKQSPSYTPLWSNTNPLTPATDCTGTVITGQTNFLVQNGNVESTFSVGVPTTGSASTTRFNSVGKVSLVRTSTETSTPIVWRNYSQTITQDSRYQSGQPVISGGAGWQTGGHFGTVLTSTNQLYAFGDNTYGEINDAIVSPFTVPFPSQYSLPSGVTSVLETKSSGQGASFECIRGNDLNIYCRGGGGGNTSAVVQVATWQKMALPAGVTSWSDFWIDGYGTDTMCALGSDQHGYCVGNDVAGEFGNGQVGVNYSLSNPQQFGSNLSLRKMAVASSQVCGITTNNALYCAGSNSYGQLGAATTGNYSTPQIWPTPPNRQVQDASISYHTYNAEPVVHVLMTDGTIWGAGSYALGDLGNNTTTGSTGTSQTPVLFNPTNISWQTGGTIFNSPGQCAGAGSNSGCCVDNSGSSSNPGNKIQLYQCNGTTAQTWVYDQINGPPPNDTNKINPYHHITNLGTGMCLDLSGGKTAETPVVLEPCSNSDTQRWVLATDSNGNPIIHPYLNSAQCMDATGAGTINGTAVEIWDCYNNNPQIYRTATTATNTSPAIQGGFNGWVDMITGTNHFCGVRTDPWSGLWCAGGNADGQLMNMSPHAGNYMGSSCTNSGGAVWNANFGWYDSGGVYHGDAIDPARLSDEWRQQYLSMMVIGLTGNVYAAGENTYGKLGNGSSGATSCTTSEVQLPSGVTALGMSARDEFSSYILGSDYRVYASGYNNSGQLGDGTTTNRLTPVQVKLPRQNLVY